MSREDIEYMLNNVADSSLDSAEQNFNAAISEKIASALENMRVSVASQLVGTNEEVEQIDEVSGELLGRYIQAAGKDISKRNAANKELNNLPAVKKLEDKLRDWYTSRTYNSKGDSVHQDKIKKAHQKVLDIKKKVDPNYPDSVSTKKRRQGIDDAIHKLKYGKLSD